MKPFLQSCGAICSTAGEAKLLKQVPNTFHEKIPVVILEPLCSVTTDNRKTSC